MVLVSSAVISVSLTAMSIWDNAGRPSVMITSVSFVKFPFTVDAVASPANEALITAVPVPLVPLVSPVNVAV